MTKKKNGFTLIELLVVIAIIAMLLAILGPSLRLAKETATSAVCLAHLSGLTKAWTLYAGENEKPVSLHQQSHCAVFSYITAFVSSAATG